MKKNKAIFPAVIAALLLVFCGAIAVSASSGTPGDSGSKYEKLNVNEITGQGQEPEDISVSSEAGYSEKEWYEYITYSDKPVSSYKLTDSTRLIFYDPYDYHVSMIMDVSYDDKIGWDTRNSVSIEHTFSKTFEFGKSEENTYSSTNEHASGQDYTYTEVENTGKTVTEYNHKSVEKSEHQDASTGGSISHTFGTGLTFERTHSETKGSDTTVGGGMDVGASAGVGKAGSASFGVNVNLSHTWTSGSTDGTTIGGSTNNETSSENSWSRGLQIGNSTVNVTGTDTITETSSSKTEGWTTIADRITTSTGSSSSTNTGWTNEESTTITETYDAAYFSPYGAPYPWTIAYYEVKMPMKCAYQVLVNNDWVTAETGYCLLTTIQGACRAWRSNDVTYFEHWGTGEPVVWNEFMSGFFKKDKLLESYQKDLYPSN